MGDTRWTTLFNAFVRDTGLLKNSEYNGDHNPLIAGGLRSSALDYQQFLHAYFTGEILSDRTRQIALADHTAAPVALTNVPRSITNIVDQTWHYGLGVWRVCPFATYQPSCDELGTVHSIGAFGFMPWIDYQRGYYGIIAREGRLLSGAAESYQLFEHLRPYIEAVVAQ